MTYPPNTTPINTQYITNITARINAIDVCSELQSVVNDAFAIIQQQLNAIQNCINQLNPLFALLTAPTDLGSLISWVGNFIKYLKTTLIPYYTMITQLSQTITAIAGLATAIENAVARIGTCSITVPTLTYPTIPTPPV